MSWFLLTSFSKDIKGSFEILLDMHPFFHICIQAFLFVISVFVVYNFLCNWYVNNITYFEIITMYNGLCCNLPFSNSENLIFPIFFRKLWNCVSASFTWILKPDLQLGTQHLPPIIGIQQCIKYIQQCIKSHKQCKYTVLVHMNL